MGNMKEYLAALPSRIQGKNKLADAGLKTSEKEHNWMYQNTRYLLIDKEKYNYVIKSSSNSKAGEN